MSQFIFSFFLFSDYGVKLTGGGSVINGENPSSFLVFSSIFGGPCSNRQSCKSLKCGVNFNPGMPVKTGGFGTAVVEGMEMSGMAVKLN